MRFRILYLRAPQFADLLKRPADLIAGMRFQQVKNIARNRAGFLAQPAATVFVKRFAPRSWFEGMRERLCGSRAARSLRGAAMLERAGFAAPAVLAAGEEIAAGAVQASWLFSEALTTARVFSRFIEPGHTPATRKNPRRRAALRAVAECIRRLHDARLFTSDLQETNLMLDERAGRMIVYFVDLDGFRRLRRVSWRRRRRNLVQLDRSVGRFMSRSERLRFLYTYLGPGFDRAVARKLVARLIIERDRKDRRFERRRRRRGLDADGGAFAEASRRTGIAAGL